MSVTTTNNDPWYWEPLKPKIVIKNRKADTTHYTFDSFDIPNSDINILYADTELASGEIGISNIIIEDSANELDITKINNENLVHIYYGKNSTSLQSYFMGFVKRFRRNRPRTNHLEYQLQVWGVETYFRGRRLRYTRAAKLLDPANPDSRSKTDPLFRAWKHVERSLTNSNVLLLKDQYPILSDLPILNTSGIDQKVEVNINILNFPNITLYDFLDRIAEYTGARWYIDYSTGIPKLVFAYPDNNIIPVNIISGEYLTQNDNAKTTSYILGGFSDETDTTPGSGYCTIPISITDADRVNVAIQSTDKGSEPLANRAIHQQVFLNFDARHLVDLHVKVSKVGNPSSTKNLLRGAISLDDGNNKPGEVIGKFNIPLDDIDVTPQWVPVQDLDIKSRFIKKDQPIHLEFYQRSGQHEVHKSKPNNDLANCIRVHHDGLFNTTRPTYSGRAAGGDRDDRDKFNWVSTNQGPTYCFSIFSSVKRLQYNKILAGIRRAGVIEEMIDTSFLTDSKDVRDYLNLVGVMAAKPKITTPVTVSIPNDFIFRPNSFVSFRDAKSQIDDLYEIVRTRIISSALPGDNGIGATDMDITLGGYETRVLNSFNCNNK